MELIVLVAWLLLPLIPASIASRKGHSGEVYYLFGLFLFVPALIVALLIQPKTPAPARPPVGAAEPSQLPPAGPASPAAGTPWRPPPPGPGVVRECPHCKEPMRRDASVCPHCRRESRAWTYRDGRWWTVDPEGTDVWYDELAAVWRRAGEEPRTQLLFDVVLLDAGRDPEHVVRILREEVETAPEELRRLVSTTPALVLHRAGYATAEGIRSALERIGARAELREL
jgi:ribosomal protein L7/L12